MSPVAIIFSHPNSPLLDLTLTQANSQSCKERKGEMSGVQEGAEVCTEEPVCIWGTRDLVRKEEKKKTQKYR